MEYRVKYSKSVKLLTEHHLEFLSLKASCHVFSESTLVKMPHCWKSRYLAIGTVPGLTALQWVSA